MKIKVIMGLAAIVALWITFASAASGVDVVLIRVLNPECKCNQSDFYTKDWVAECYSEDTYLIAVNPVAGTRMHGDCQALDCFQWPVPCHTRKYTVTFAAPQNSCCVDFYTKKNGTSQGQGSTSACAGDFDLICSDDFSAVQWEEIELWCADTTVHKLLAKVTFEFECSACPAGY